MSKMRRGVCIKCAFCGRDWYPKHARSVADVYCPKCHDERVAEARKHFDCRPVTPEEMRQPYIRRGRITEPQGER